MLQTARLELRPVALTDRAFIFRLVNEPSWIANIGDRGVRSEDDAENYIRHNIWRQYDAHGFGLYAVQLRAAGAPIGLCGLIKRDYLNAPDLGFALLPEYVGYGYAAEAADALLSHATAVWKIEQLHAIVNADNQRSLTLLHRLGFRKHGTCTPPEGHEIDLYAWTSRNAHVDEPGLMT
jgi:ribosomal-protein-alanine N-acetyltransferase